MKSLCDNFGRAVRHACLVLCLCATWPVGSWAQTNFAVLVNDGAWTWFNDPRAVFHNGMLYFGYVRSSDGRSTLSELDLRSGQVTNLWTSSLTQTDDHDDCGLLVKQDQTMLAIYSRHQNDQFFTYRLATSTNPVSPGDWGVEQTNNTGTTVSSGMTYANPYQLSNESGKIYNFARYLNYNPNVFTSTDGGATWSTPQILIQTGTGSTRPYVKYCSDYVQRIDFLYTDAHPDNFTTSLYHAYYQGGAFYQTDGTFLKSYANLPLLHDSGERGTVIYQYSDAGQADPNQWIPTGRAWCWEIGYQTNGAPVCVFQVKVDNVTGTAWSDARIYYYYARWTGTSWQKRFIAQAGRPLYNGQPDYGGGICVDPQNPNTIYISTDAANPFDLTTTTNVPLGANYQIWKGVTTDGGLTFSWLTVTGNSSLDNLRPYIPRRFGGEACVLWFRGTYAAYTSFNCSVVGLFTTAVPQTNSFPVGTWIADADGVWSDSSKWAQGVIPDSATNTADFSQLNFMSADRTVTLDSPRTVGALKFGNVTGTENWTVKSSGGNTLTLGGTPMITVNQNQATLAVGLSGVSGFTKAGAGTLVLSGSNALSGPLNLDRGIDGDNNDGATRITSSNAIANVSSINIRNTSVSTAGGATLQIDGSAGGIVVTQNLSLTCRNNGTTPTVENLAGTNTLAGTNLIQVGGTNVLYQADVGSLLLIAAPIQYVGSLTSARTFSFLGDGNVTVSGPVLKSTGSAPTGIIKSGTGTLTLVAANTYTNGTTVNGGLLQLNGSLSVGRVSVVGGTLAGSGTIAGPVTVFTGGTLAPGGSAAPGPLMVNNAATNSGTIAIRLSKSGAVLTNDSIRGVSTLALGGTLQLSTSGGQITVGDTFTLFSATSYIGAFASLAPAVPGAGLVWNTNSLAVNGTLVVGLGAVSPKIDKVSVQGTNFVMRASGGAAGYSCSVVTSTNLGVPRANWALAGSGACDSSGGFSFTNGIGTAGQRFYAFRVP
jgi:autotransporter-associated beta strand protein